MERQVKLKAKTLIDTQVKVKAQGLYDSLTNTRKDLKAETLAKVKAKSQLDDNPSNKEVETKDKTLTDMEAKTLTYALPDTLAEKKAATAR